MHDPEKSHSAVVAVKPPNKVGSPAAEAVEPRAGTKGNADQQSTHRTQTRERVTQALNRVRQAARQRKKERFTALLHHVDVDTLRTAFYALKRKAAAGVDGVTWQDYEATSGGSSRTSTGGSTGERIGRNHLAGRTYRRRMVGKGRWRSQLWKTRSFRAHAPWCSTPSTKRISSGSHTGSDLDEDQSRS
jgi:hypothetical protein